MPCPVPPPPWRATGAVPCPPLCAVATLPVLPGSEKLGEGKMLRLSASGQSLQAGVLREPVVPIPAQPRGDRERHEVPQWVLCSCLWYW